MIWIFFSAVILALVGIAVFGKGGFFPILITAAAIDSVNPCAFSVLILTIGFLMSLGRTRFNILKIGLVYILGIFLVYMAIGLGILRVLDILNVPHLMGKVAATALIAFGVLSLINGLFPKSPIRLGIPRSTHKKLAAFMSKGSVPMAFILGILVGAFEFPCVAGPYLLILGMLHDQGMFLSGLGYLTLYNFIFILPLVVILLAVSEEKVLKKVEEWKKASVRNLRIFGGAAMILLGLVILMIY